MKTYPYECCRCGFYYLHTTCVIGQAVYGPVQPCPALSFTDDIASCELAGTVPVGDGCCIAARAYKDGVEYDFAALPPELKRTAARDLKQKLINEKEKNEGYSN